MRYHLLTDRNGLPLHGRHDRPGRPRRGLDKLHTDKSYDYLGCHRYRHRQGIKAWIARRRIEPNTRLGQHRWAVERAILCVLRVKRLGLAFRPQRSHDF